MADKSISFHKLNNLINCQDLLPFDFDFIESESFRVVSEFEGQDRYIEPFFSVQYTNGEIENCNVILLSAPGATGKTMLTNTLSQRLNIPVFDLSKHNPVASHSLTGLLSDVLAPRGFADYAQRMEDGTGSMLIDALDEGFVKTTDEGYFSFLDDLSKYAKDSKGVPFILLGRTNIVELTALHLEACGLKVLMAKIEPFTIEQAKAYIDLHVKSDSRKTNPNEYIQVRNYIIEALEGFFRNQNEINHNQFKQFIGYAPVLNAISVLLADHKNYHKLYESLQQGNFRNIELLVDIVTRILAREKKDKIIPNLLEEMLRGHDEAFSKEVKDKAYSIEEQCCRLLSKQLDETPNIVISTDSNFNSNYNERVISFANEHPFLDSHGKIQNVVFLSFILSTLVRSPKYKQLVFRYLRSKYNSPYLLFDIYSQMSGDNRTIDLAFCPYLFESLRALDDKKRHATMEIAGETQEDSDEDMFSGNVVFTKAGYENSPIIFDFVSDTSTSLSLCPTITNLDINIPTEIEIPGRKIEMISPVRIECKKIKCAPSEILISKGDDTDCRITIFTEIFDADYSNTGTISITNRDNIKRGEFDIISSNQLDFPFINFHTIYVKKKIPENIEIRFHKLKNIMGWFRSHSKGDLARYKELIDNVAVGSSKIGKSIIKKLLAKGVLYVEESKYFINSEKMTEVLGLSKDALNNGDISKKAEDFLSKLD